MGEQAKQDLELLRKARYEVQKLEEIHGKIRKEEREIEKYEEMKSNGIEYAQRATNKAKIMQKEFSGENSFRRFQKMNKLVKRLRILLIVYWIISFIVVNLTLPKDFWPEVDTICYCIMFWMGNLVVYAGLWYIPDRFSC